jgi:ABC-type antimicrobial peptide transport system permease subunit
VGALLLGVVLTSQFSAVQPADTAAIACVAASLVVVTLLAGLRPALRATRVDPLTALRQE